jgi:hypothetical protein
MAHVLLECIKQEYTATAEWFIVCLPNGGASPAFEDSDSAAGLLKLRLRSLRRNIHTLGSYIYIYIYIYMTHICGAHIWGMPENQHLTHTHTHTHT